MEIVSLPSVACDNGYGALVLTTQSLGSQARWPSKSIKMALLVSLIRITSTHMKVLGYRRRFKGVHMAIGFLSALGGWIPCSGHAFAGIAGKEKGKLEYLAFEVFRFPLF